MTDQAGLSGSDGSVLDPIVAIRNRVMLEPDQAVTVDIVSGMAESRDVAVCLVEKYRDRHLADRVFELTWTHSQVVLQQLNASEADSQLYARLASVVIHADGRLRGEPSVLMKNRRGQSGLWGYAISGDLPIVLLQIMDATHIDLVRQLVQAHAYWRLKGLVVDLVIWNEDHAGYRQQLQEQIMGLIASDVGASVIDRPGASSYGQPSRSRAKTGACSNRLPRGDHRQPGNAGGAARPSSSGRAAHPLAHPGQHAAAAGSDATDTGTRGADPRQRAGRLQCRRA